MSEPVLPRGTFTLVFPPGTFAAEQPPNLLWPWITPPSHPAELPSVQSHPSSCSPACVPWNVPIPELLETAGTSPCSFPAALAVSSPFHPQRFAWNTGKKLPLQGLLWSFLGVGREKVFLRGFEPFQLTLHPEQATANPKPSEFSEPAQPCPASQHLPAFGFPSFSMFQIGFFLLVLGGRCGLNWFGEWLCGWLSPGNSACKKGEREPLSLLLATGIVSAQERGTLVLFLCSLH